MKKSVSYITTIIIIAISFGIIFAANSFIESQKAKQGTSSEYATVYPDGTNFEEIELENEQENIEKIILVSDNSGEVGYVFEALAQGYGGDISYRIGISNEGIVQGFEVLEHSETEGFGAGITEDSFKEGLIGTNVSTGNVSFGEGNKEEGEIVAVSGATITTTAFTNSLVEVVNSLSQVKENIAEIKYVMPYYSKKWQSLFKNDLSIFTFEEFMSEDFYKDGIQRIIRVKNESGEIDSYIIEAIASGFHGNIEYLLRVTPEYRVYAIEFGKQDETPELGGYIEDPQYKETLKGVNLDKNLLTKAIKLRLEPTQEKDILLISGATVTSNGMKESLDEVINDLVRFNKVREDETKYEVLDLENLETSQDEAA